MLQEDNKRIFVVRNGTYFKLQSSLRIVNIVELHLAEFLQDACFVLLFLSPEVCMDNRK